MAIFFHDVPVTEGEHWASLLKPHSIGALWSEQSYAAIKDIPSTYVICQLDRVIPPEQQEGMIKNAREVQEKAFDVVERLECGHEPIISNIDDLVEILERASTGKRW